MQKMFSANEITFLGIFINKMIHLLIVSREHEMSVLVESTNEFDLYFLLTGPDGNANKFQFLSLFSLHSGMIRVL